MSVIVHHLNDSRSQRILWLLEELEVPYEVVRHQRDPHSLLAPAALRAVHPLGKAPVIVDHGETVAETGHIIEHLLERYGLGRLQPPQGSPEARRMRYWLHYAEGSAMTPLLLKLVFGQLPKRSPGLVRPLVNAVAAKAQTGFVDPQIASHMAYWEGELGKSVWFAGPDFSAADVMMSFPVEAAASRVGLGPEFPNLKAFLERIHARPAYRRALEQGGDYAYAS
jgi:glutathione S-transferase